MSPAHEPEPEPAPIPPWPVVLRALREARGITREGWAARLGYSASTVQRWERGETAPDASAEAALLSLVQEEGLLRPYTAGPLRGLSLSAAELRRVLEEARSAKGRPAPPPAVLSVVRDPIALPRLGSLPTAPTNLLGRERELEAVTELLRATRLLTLTGPGGVGKTRLAMEAARTEAPNFADGVCFVELAPLREAAQVAAIIARALDLRDLGSESPLARVKQYLAQRSLLLVLDNCEHLPDAAPQVGELLAACPALTVLATSRALLHLRGEHAFLVPPLPYEAVPTASNGPADLSGPAPAVALFVRAASAVAPGFALTTENATAVVEICRRLDGLPLAIELAASRSRLLAPRALLAHMERRLPLLTGGARDLPDRQQTMRATIAWSHDLLSAGEQVLLRRLSVFAGACTLEAAQTVCGGGLDGVLDHLDALVDKNLLLVREGAAAESRFTMLETVREYAREQLEASGEAEQVRRRHAAYFLAFAEARQSRNRVVGSAAAARTQVEMQAALTEAHTDLRVALAWAVEFGDADAEAATLGMRLSIALYSWFFTEAPVEGWEWARRLVALQGAQHHTATRAEALYFAGFLATSRLPADDRRAAQPLLRDSVALWHELGDKRALGNALTVLGRYPDVGDPAARLMLDEGVALLREVGDPDALSNGLHGLGLGALHRSEYGVAQAAFEEALALRRQLGRLPSR